MQSERQRAEGSGSARVGLIRGVLVIVTAVAIGAFVVTQGLTDDDADTGTAIAADGAAGDSSADGADTTGTTSQAGADDGSAEVAGAEANSDGTMEDASDGDAMSDGADGSAADGSDGSATTEGETTNTTDDAEPAGPEVQAPADVTVLVLNGAGAKGVAGRGSAVLQDAGYDVLAPKNADFLGPSKVLYSDGFEEEAAEVAAAFGVDPVAVIDVLDLSAAPINDTRNANIVVVVGEDGLINV